MGKKQPKYPLTNGLTKLSKTNPVPPNSSQESLAQILSTKEHLSEIQKYLYGVVNAIHDNPSFLNRASTAWGNRPTWQKIVGGTLVFGTLFTIGILAHLLVLILTGVALATEFVIGSYLLEEHHRTNKHSKEALKSGMLGLAKVLELTITALDEIREQLATEIDKFKQENSKFSSNLSKLDKEIGLLNEELKQLDTTKEALNRTKDKLAGLTHDHELLNNDMGKKVAELAGVKSAMGLEIKRLTDVSAVLKGTVETLLPSLISDEAQRAVFQTKMEAFLRDSSTSFNAVADRICQAEQDLSVCRAALEQSNKCYKQLLGRHEAQVDKLEKICEKQSLEQGKNTVPVIPLTKDCAWMAMFQSGGVNEKSAHEISTGCRLSSTT